VGSLLKGGAVMLNVIKVLEIQVKVTSAPVLVPGLPGAKTPEAQVLSKFVISRPVADTLGPAV
jgi:hypothetical protein